MKVLNSTSPPNSCPIEEVAANTDGALENTNAIVHDSIVSQSVDSTTTSSVSNGRLVTMTGEKLFVSFARKFNSCLLTAKSKQVRASKSCFVYENHVC